MKSKLAVVVTLAAVAMPVAAQTPQTREDEQIRPPRGGAAVEQREPEDPQLERFRQDYLVPRRYEGRAEISDQRYGKCPPYGRVRATVTGNRFTATMTFPIEARVIQGSVNGAALTGTGDFGYTMEGDITEGSIRATVLKKGLVRQPPPKPGVAVPLVPGPTTRERREPPPDNCIYRITLVRMPS